MTKKQAEKRALELYPVAEFESWNDFSRRFDVEDMNEEVRIAYMKCWEDMQPPKCKGDTIREIILVDNKKLEDLVNELQADR